MGRNKARVGLKTIFRDENVGGPLFLGSHFGGKMKSKCVQKDMQKLIKFSHAFLVKLGRIWGLFWRILVDKIAIQVEHIKQQK